MIGSPDRGQPNAEANLPHIKQTTRSGFPERLILARKPRRAWLVAAGEGRP